MSELFKCHRTPATMKAGVMALARLMHEAEDADNDILLLGVVDELATRSPLENEVFREAYMHYMKTRMERTAP